METTAYEEYTLEEIEENLEPVAGATILGALDKGMLSSYQELASAELALQEMTEVLQKRLLEKLGGTLAQWDGETAHEFSHRLSQHSAFDNRAEAEKYFELVSRWEYLNTGFWYSVRLNFSCFSQRIGIRSGFKIVTVGDKYAS